jgi:hypothetical protein
MGRVVAENVEYYWLWDVQQMVMVNLPVLTQIKWLMKIRHWESLVPWKIRCLYNSGEKKQHLPPRIVKYLQPQCPDTSNICRFYQTQ